MKSYRALTSIFYISTKTGDEVFVKKGDIFNDMDNVGVMHEIQAGNIEEVSDDGVSS